MFNGTDYDQLNTELADATTNAELQANNQERFKWLEYYKVNFKGDWYSTLAGNLGSKSLVLRTNAEFGFIGNYNSKVGNVPFERFYVGGSGMGNFTLDGRENIQLRGYDDQSITPYVTNPLTGNFEPTGGIIYNKFSMELRYPLTLKPSASIYGLVFAEGGNAFNNLIKTQFQAQQVLADGKHILLLDNNFKRLKHVLSSSNLNSNNN